MICSGTTGIVEVFSDNPEQSLARQAVPNRKGVFVVLVPDTEEGHTVTLSGSPQRIELAHQPAPFVNK